MILTLNLYLIWWEVLLKKRLKDFLLVLNGGHKEAIKKGRVLGSNSITGYKKDDAKLVIVEEEAKK